MKITVEKKKKSVVVVDFGHAPFAVIEKHNRKVYIPDGFTVETFCFTRMWIGQTSVRDNVVQYQFFLKSEPHKTSGWQKSASAALALANERVKNKHFTPGSNGALVIGVTYPNLQDEIIKRFGSRLEQETEEEDDMEAEDGNARAPEFPSSSSLQEPPSFGAMEMFEADEAEDLEPLCLEPAKVRETSCGSLGACGSLDVDLKAFDSYFGSDCDKLEKPIFSEDFRSSSFEESQDPDFFLCSNDPLELDY